MRTLILATTLAIATPALADVPVPERNPRRIQEAPATSGHLCAPRQVIVDMLQERYGETQSALGLQSDGRVLEIFAAPHGGWTAIVTQPNGTSCAVAVGEGWTITQALGRDA